MRARVKVELGLGSISCQIREQEVGWGHRVGQMIGDDHMSISGWERLRLGATGCSDRPSEVNVGAWIRVRIGVGFLLYTSMLTLLGLGSTLALTVTSSTPNPNLL